MIENLTAAIRRCQNGHYTLRNKDIAYTMRHDEFRRDVGFKERQNELRHFENMSCGRIAVSVELGIDSVLKYFARNFEKDCYESKKVGGKNRNDYRIRCFENRLISPLEKIYFLTKHSLLLKKFIVRFNVL